MTRQCSLHRACFGSLVSQNTAYEPSDLAAGIDSTGTYKIPVTSPGTPVEAMSFSHGVQMFWQLQTVTG